MDSGCLGRLLQRMYGWFRTMRIILTFRSQSGHEQLIRVKSVGDQNVNASIRGLGVSIPLNDNLIEPVVGSVYACR
jgi:hypothetical protein